jgi:hypothetical protein
VYLKDEDGKWILSTEVTKRIGGKKVKLYLFNNRHTANFRKKQLLA